MSQPPPPPPPQTEEQSLFPQRQKLFILLSLLPIFILLVSRQLQVNLPVPNLSRSTKAPDDIISLTFYLAQIPSVSGHEQQVFKYVEQWLSARNLTILQQTVPPLTPSHLSRQNLLALHGDIKDVEVLLCTHLDTVPGGPAAGIINDTLVGRGVVDAKGQAAGFMLALVQMRDPRVGLLLVSGEESDHKGMVVASELGIPDGVTLLNGEPTEGMLAARQKGIVKGLIKVIGKRAHSGYPHLGDSAVDKLLDVIAKLRETWPGERGETMNVGLIKGGTAPNVVAGEAEARIMWRVIDKATDVVDKIVAVIAGFEGVTIEIITMNDAVELFVPDKAGREFGVTEVAYNTDVPYYHGGYQRAVVFGGGSITVAHTEEEAVAVSEMREFGERVKQLVGELL